MNRHDSLLTIIIFSVLSAIALSSGCRDKAASQGGPAAARTKPTPEESFDLIFETFRRGIQTGPNGVSGSFVTNEASGRTRLTVNNSVEKELIPPANAEEPYRAKITVVSRSHYSLTRAEQEAEEAERRAAKKQQSGLEELNGAGPANGVNVLDPELMSTSKGLAGERDEAITDPVSRENVQVERIYELIYQEGRWRLLTKLDEATEQAIKSAFNEAFRTQT